MWVVPVIALSGLLSLGTNRAMAQFTNGNFETGDFTGWTVVTGSQATVTNAPGSPFDVYATTFNALLTNGTATSSTIASEMTNGNTLGLTITTAQLDALTAPDPVGDGAVIFQTFTGSGTLTFNFGFANAEGTGGGFHDALFVYLDGTFTKLRDADVDEDDTAYATFTVNGLASGTHFIAVGAVNAGDGLVDSQGIFDNFSISGSSVPEPSAFLLLGGLAVAAVGYRPIKSRLKRRLVKA